MKKNVVLLVGILLFFTATSVFGEDKKTGPYFSANIGMAFPSDSDITDSTVPGITAGVESDSGLALGAALGYDFGILRFEGEIGWQKNDLDKLKIIGINFDLTGDASIISFLLNLYIDMENSTPFTPFFGVGVGLANVDINDLNVPGSGLPSSSGDETVFAWQIGGGLGYAVSQSTTLEIKYRYFATKDAEFGTTKVELASHNIYLGARFAF